jgi:hypothetical protein
MSRIKTDDHFRRRRYLRSASAIGFAHEAFMNAEHFEEQRREMVAAVRAITGHLYGPFDKGKTPIITVLISICRALGCRVCDHCEGVEMPCWREFLTLGRPGWP